MLQHTIFSLSTVASIAPITTTMCFLAHESPSSWLCSDQLWVREGSPPLQQHGFRLSLRCFFSPAKPCPLFVANQLGRKRALKKKHQEAPWSYRSGIDSSANPKWKTILYLQKDIALTLPKAVPINSPQALWNDTPRKFRCPLKRDHFKRIHLQFSKDRFREISQISRSFAKIPSRGVHFAARAVPLTWDLDDPSRSGTTLQLSWHPKGIATENLWQFSSNNKIWQKIGYRML